MTPEIRTRISGFYNVQIKLLSFSKKKPKANEIAQVLTELRHELHVAVTFILNTINSNPDLPHLSKSNYYYVLKHNDKDLKNHQIMKRIKKYLKNISIDTATEKLQPNCILKALKSIIRK